MDSSYGMVILNLLGVLALIFAAVFILKKVRLGKFLGNKQIAMINAIGIGAKEKIMLVRVKDKVFLIGATPHHIQTLHVFDDTFDVEGVKLEPASFNSVMAAQQQTSAQ